MGPSRSVSLATFFVALVAILSIGFGAARAGAAEETFKTEFESSKISVSLLKNLPLDQLSSTASMEGTIDDDGAVKIPKGKFLLPELGITEPLAIKGFMGIESAATGTFDKNTGQLDLDTTAGIWVSVNTQQILGLVGSIEGGTNLLGGLGGLGGLIPKELTCGFSPMKVHFTTEGNEGGVRFTKGLGGPGAISANWSKLGKFTGRGGLSPIICGLVKDQLPGLLTGLGGGAGTGGLDIGGLLGGLDLTQLDAIDLGPSSIALIRESEKPVVVNPPPPPPPGVDKPALTPAKLKLRVSPKKRRAKAGSKVKYVAVVKNIGGTTARNVSVCIKAPKGATKKPSRCGKLGSITKGKAKKRTFVLRLKKSAVRRSYRIGFKIKSGARVKPASVAQLRIR